VVDTQTLDLTDDLNPNLWVRCHGDGAVDVERRLLKKTTPAKLADISELSGMLKAFRELGQVVRRDLIRGPRGCQTVLSAV
jgi:hypothetical protein